MYIRQQWAQALLKQSQKKSQYECGTGIFLYVGHTGFEPVTSTLSR